MRMRTLIVLMAVVAKLVAQQDLARHEQINITTLVQLAEQSYPLCVHEASHLKLE